VLHFDEIGIFRMKLSWLKETFFVHQIGDTSWMFDKFDPSSLHGFATQLLLHIGNRLACATCHNWRRKERPVRNLELPCVIVTVKGRS